MDFNRGPLSDFQKGVGRSLIGRMDNVIEEQRRRAGYMADRLRAIGGIYLLKGHVAGRPTYPFLPVIFEDAGRCGKVYSALQCHGLGVSRLYTRPINRYEYLGGLVPKGIFPNAESISGRMLTLPTHSCVTMTDMDRIVDIIKRIV
jgi:dTDP-4-amino-4,6-dideoxygalactose transaminase